MNYSGLAILIGLALLLSVVPVALLVRFATRDYFGRGPSWLVGLYTWGWLVGALVIWLGDRPTFLALAPVALGAGLVVLALALWLAAAEKRRRLAFWLVGSTALLLAVGAGKRWREQRDVERWVRAHRGWQELEGLATADLFQRLRGGDGTDVRPVAEALIARGYAEVDEARGAQLAATLRQETYGAVPAVVELLLSSPAGVAALDAELARLDAERLLAVEQALEALPPVYRGAIATLTPPPAARILPALQARPAGPPCYPIALEPCLFDESGLREPRRAPLLRRRVEKNLREP